MNRLHKEQIETAMELRLPEGRTSSVLALVEDMCAYTAESSPEAAEMAEKLYGDFAEWLLVSAGMPAEAWISARAATPRTGKEWVREAMACGFKP